MKTTMTTKEDDDDDDDNDDVGAFSNEVEGGVPGAPHSTLIKKLHILNQTPTYQCSVIEKDEIDLLMKKITPNEVEGGNQWKEVRFRNQQQLENTELVGWLIHLKFPQK